MLFNKVSGGSEKVTIDGKPVRDKTNLKEVDSIIESRATFPYYVMLTRKENLFIVGDPYRGIYKGNPYTEWTEILKINLSSNMKAEYIKINDDDTIDLFCSYENELYIYKFKNGEITLVEKKKMAIGSVFELNKILYINSNNNIYTYKNGELTDITKNIIVTGNYDYYPYYTASDLDKNYIMSEKDGKLKLIKPYNPAGQRLLVLAEFDGINLKVVKRLTTQNLNGHNKEPYRKKECTCMSNSKKAFYILQSDKTIAQNRYEYIVYDEELNEVIRGYSYVSMTSFYSLINASNPYIIAKSDGINMIEFPMKVYVKE